MSKTSLLRFVASLALFISAAFGSAPRPTLAYSLANFTVTAKSAYLHSAPSLASARVDSAFKGQTFGITGRSLDKAWVKLDFAGAVTDVWVLSVLGTITGDLNGVPVMAGSGDVSAPPLPTPPPPATGGPLPATTPVAPSPSVPRAQPAVVRVASAGPTTASLRFIITVKSAYLRSEPSLSSAKVASVFQGQVYSAVGRTADNLWLELSDGSWAGASIGQLSQAIWELAITAGGLPAAAAPSVTLSASTATTPTLPLPTGAPTITQHMRDVYAAAAKHGLNPFAFATAGDCNSEPYIYLELAAANLINIPAYGSDLKETVGQFYPSFLRRSVAVRGSFGTAAMFDPQWSDPAQCQPGEGVFACELRVTNASIVFIALGTGDHLRWQDFEANDRRLIQYALSRGVLPVLVTKSDNLEATPPQEAPSGYINSVIRKLGSEYEVPVMDLNAATASFYNHGEQKDGFHLDEFGIKAHVLLTVQTLDEIWRAPAP